MVTLASAGPLRRALERHAEALDAVARPCGSFFAVAVACRGGRGAVLVLRQQLTRCRIPPPSTTTNKTKTVPLFMTISVSIHCTTAETHR